MRPRNGGGAWGSMSLVDMTLCSRSLDGRAKSASYGSPTIILHLPLLQQEPPLPNHGRKMRARPSCRRHRSSCPPHCTDLPRLRGRMMMYASCWPDLVSTFPPPPPVWPCCSKGGHSRLGLHSHSRRGRHRQSAGARTASLDWDWAAIDDGSAELSTYSKGHPADVARRWPALSRRRPGKLVQCCCSIIHVHVVCISNKHPPTGHKMLSWHRIWPLEVPCALYTILFGFKSVFHFI